MDARTQAMDDAQPDGWYMLVLWGKHPYSAIGPKY